MVISKTKHPRVYLRMIEYPSSDLVPVNRIAEEFGIKTQAVTSLIGSAKTHSTIRAFLNQIGVPDEDIPSWFAGEKQETTPPSSQTETPPTKERKILLPLAPPPKKPLPWDPLLQKKIDDLLKEQLEIQRHELREMRDQHIIEELISFLNGNLEMSWTDYLIKHENLSPKGQEKLLNILEEQAASRRNENLMNTLICYFFFNN